METETRTVTRMPIKKCHFDLSEIGYDGWWIELRTNPRSDMYDQWFSSDEAKVWEAFGYLVVDWNWSDEEGNPLPKPPKTKREELPIDLLPFIYRKYVDVLREAAGYPKVPLDNSNGTSQTESDQENSEGAVVVENPMKPTTQTDTTS